MTKYGWARISKEEQSRGVSIQAQEELIKSQGVDLKNIYKDEGKSASISDEKIESKEQDGIYKIELNIKHRTEFINLLKVLKENDELYFTKFDRLARNILLQEALVISFTKRNILLNPIIDSNDKLTRRILSVIAQTESENIGTRVGISAKYKYDKGIHAFRSVYGYRKNTRDRRTGKLKYPEQEEGMLIIEPKESQIVSQIFALSTIFNLQQIADKVRLPRQMVVNILRNDIYCGYIHMKKEKRLGKHLPIISEKQWIEANKKI